LKINIKNRPISAAYIEKCGKEDGHLLFEKLNSCTSSVSHHTFSSMLLNTFVMILAILNRISHENQTPPAKSHILKMNHHC
jgi:hypothetical protein